VASETDRNENLSDYTWFVEEKGTDISEKFKADKRRDYYL
jgi:hypothetical protein